MRLRAAGICPECYHDAAAMVAVAKTTADDDHDAAATVAVAKRMADDDHDAAATVAVAKRMADGSDRWLSV